MGKINNSWEENGSTPVSAGQNDVTRIPYGAEIRHGIMVSSCDIRIDGPFFGTIMTKAKVIIGDKAVFKGDIFCENIDIYGTMEGNATVGEVLTFMSSCDFKGSIKVSKFSVENGAKFDGSCTIITKEDYSKLASESLDQINKEYPQISLSQKEQPKPFENKVKIELSKETI